MNIDFDDFLEYLYVTGQLDEEEKEDEDEDTDDKQLKKRR